MYIISSIILVCIVILVAIYKISNKKKFSISFKEGMDLTDLPIVTFYSNNKKLNFLLDTGSNLCVINKKVLKTIKHSIFDSKGSIYGMEGTEQEVSYALININYKDIYYHTVFQVIDMQQAFDKVKQESGVTIHGILGSKFFEEHKYILDFNELIAYSKK